MVRIPRRVIGIVLPNCRFDPELYIYQLLVTFLILVRFDRHASTAYGSLARRWYSAKFTFDFEDRGTVAMIDPRPCATDETIAACLMKRRKWRSKLPGVPVFSIDPVHRRGHAFSAPILTERTCLLRPARRQPYARNGASNFPAPCLLSMYSVYTIFLPN